MKRGTQVTQAVKAYPGGNNQPWAAVILYSAYSSTVVKYSTVRYCTIQYSSAVVYGPSVQYSSGTVIKYRSSTVPGTLQCSSSLKLDLSSVLGDTRAYLYSPVLG